MEALVILVLVTSAGGVDCCQCVLNKKIVPPLLQVTHLLSMVKKIRPKEREEGETTRRWQST